MNLHYGMYYVFCLFASISALTYALDDNFFRASWFPSEPRFERDVLNTTGLTIRTGSTHKARNADGHKTQLFDLYGTHNLAQASKGAGLDPANSTDQLFLTLTQEAASSADPHFGQFSFSGKESLTEYLVTFEQNFYRGFFLSAYVPIRHITVKNIAYTDLTRPENRTATLQTITQSLPTLLANRYTIGIYPPKNTVTCDGYLMAGWTYNNDDTETLDYLDTTLQAGLLLPSTKTMNSQYPFELYPTSNGHVGVPIRAAVSGGLFEWLTLGGSFDTTFFTPKTTVLRLKTAPEQSGLIYLQTGKAKVHQGPVVNISAYFKFDHIADVFSLLLGYSYAHKNDDSVYPYADALSCSIINSDPRFNGWKMHTMHFTGEYDFSKEDHRFGPRVGLFYDKILAGKSITNCSMVGGLFGLEIALDLP